RQAIRSKSRDSLVELQRWNSAMQSQIRDGVGQRRHHSTASQIRKQLRLKRETQQHIRPVSNQHHPACSRYFAKKGEYRRERWIVQRLWGAALSRETSK